MWNIEEIYKGSDLFIREYEMTEVSFTCNDCHDGLLMECIITDIREYNVIEILKKRGIEKIKHLKRHLQLSLGLFGIRIHRFKEEKHDDKVDALSLAFDCLDEPNKIFIGDMEDKNKFFIAKNIKITPKISKKHESKKIIPYRVNTIPFKVEMNNINKIIELDD